MKAKDIENEMRKVTEEGRVLQEKLAIIESLKDCYENGHDWDVIEHDMTFETCHSVTYKCRKSGACVIIGTKHHTHEIDGKWRWYDGPFEGMTVEEVYEIEDTDPLPQPSLVREKEALSIGERNTIEMPDGGSYELMTEPDGKGGYVTKMVPKE